MLGRFVLAATASAAFATAAHAQAQVLDGAPVSVNTAQSWCIAQRGPLPNWDSPAHPDCKMVWRVLAERDGRTLYSARYAWPTVRSAEAPSRILTEVLFEGVQGSRVVRRLYAVQDDEANIRLDPLRYVQVQDAPVIESKVCMTGTDECGRELAAWYDGRVEMIKDLTIAEIRSRLPHGYGLNATPEVDLSSLTGKGKAWAKGDADCCPSAAIEFTMRLDGNVLHLQEMQLKRRSG